jgi:hypothetical protein
MAINALRGLRNRASRAPAAPAAPADQVEFDDWDHPAEDAARGPRVACPNCGRQLGLFQIECPGCGLHVLAGVPLKRGGLLVIAGCAGGLIIGAVLAVGLALLPGSSSAAASGPAPSAEATATLDPSTDPALISGPVPPTAAAALRLTATVEDRMSVSAGTLRKQLKSGFSAVAAATTIRQVAADAAWGSGLVDRLDGWAAAAPLRAQLGATYATLRAAARDALGVSMKDNAKYKLSAKKMVKLLGSADDLRKAIEALATANRISIPAPPASP